eukprot:1190079-Prorocentrum_minimum.AAC.9
MTGNGERPDLECASSGDTSRSTPVAMTRSTSPEEQQEGTQGALGKGYRGGPEGVQRRGSRGDPERGNYGAPPPASSDPPRPPGGDNYRAAYVLGSAGFTRGVHSAHTTGALVRSPDPPPPAGAPSSLGMLLRSLTGYVAVMCY